MGHQRVDLAIVPWEGTLRPVHRAVCPPRSTQTQAGRQARTRAHTHTHTHTHTQRALSQSQASQFSPRASCQPCPTGSSERGGRGRGRRGGGKRTLASGAAAQRRLQTAQQMGATNSTNRPARLGAGPPITPTIRSTVPVCQDKWAKRLPCTA